ncbi:MAG TPA: LuxR C-terminal-related transcriptional regulator, partial [Ornithinibacter sp.]|nr:LuxR C-terminal-related transcriptional regulator [Ornithinibacter sp.]
ARLTAARLATHQGRQREAEAHLARAEELFADTTDFLAFQFDAVRAMARLGAGDPAGAHEAAMTGALAPGVPPTLCEWLCPLAARALADLWRRAAELLDGACRWDAKYATYRAGEAALVGGGRPREEAAALLRRAHSLAVDLRAEPVLREVVDLARSARIPLDEVRATAEPAPGEERLHGLTVREREVLDHVVAGRTYGEIARALFVSEKTVSSHISHLLRKTGAANRVELARLARHSGARADPNA